MNGRGVEVDEKKAMYYYELGAFAGDEYSRSNLALKEDDLGNIKREH